MKRTEKARAAYEEAQTRLDHLDAKVAARQVNLIAAVELAQELDRELTARRPFDRDWDGWVAAWLEAHELCRSCQIAYDVLIAERAQQARLTALARRVLAEAHARDRMEFAPIPAWVN